MTKEELNQYITLNNKFRKECERVVEELSRIKDTYYDHCTDFNIYRDTVYAKGTSYVMGELEEFEEMFSKDLLTFSPQELKKYVDNVIKAEEDEEARIKHQLASLKDDGGLSRWRGMLI